MGNFVVKLLAGLLVVAPVKALPICEGLGTVSLDITVPSDTVRSYGSNKKALTLMYAYVIISLEVFYMYDEYDDIDLFDVFVLDVLGLFDVLDLED